MRKLFLISILFIIALESCVVDDFFFSYLNNEEIIQLNSDNTGSYSLNFSLNDFLKQNENILKANPKFSEFKKVDTTINFSNSLSKNLTILTDEEREIFSGGKANIHLDLANSKGDFIINLFYKNIDQLAFQRAHILSFIVNNIQFGIFLLVDKNVTESIGNNEIDFNVTDSTKTNRLKVSSASIGLNPVGKSFTMKILPHSITYKFTDTASYNKILLPIKKSSGDFKSIFYKTTFILPGKVLSYEGSFESISQDKKTITFKNSLADLFDKTGLFEYSISY